MELWTSWDAWA